MAALTNVTLESGGTVICNSPKGTLNDTTGKIKLTETTWPNISARDQLAYLQKKVTLKAKLSRGAEPKRSYAKPMYIIGITPGANEAQLADKPES